MLGLDSTSINRNGNHTYIHTGVGGKGMQGWEAKAYRGGRHRHHKGVGGKGMPQQQYDKGKTRRQQKQHPKHQLQPAINAIFRMLLVI